MADGSLMRTQYPALQQRHHAMNAGEQFRGPRRLPVQVAHLVAIAVAFEWPVTQPTVGVDHAAGFDRLANEGHQAVPGGVRNRAHPNSSDACAIFLGRYCNQRFRVGLAAPHALLQGS